MAENIENNGCSQRDNAEHEGYVKASRSFNRIWKERDSAQPRLLEAILYKDNFNRAYKRVKANKGAPGIDGMTIEEALPYLKEHQQEITDRIYRGKYTPSPVRRVEIPKPDGGVRKLGIPTVVDRTSAHLLKANGLTFNWRGGGMKNTLSIYHLVYIANRVNSNVT